ncbi:helix-turn-helix domain-containing protein [Bacillus sp. AK031]
MGLVNKIKSLCDEKKLTFAEVERKVGLSNGQIRRWDTSSPKIENVQKVADFFDVSTDYILGRTDKKRFDELTAKDERDIKKELQRMIEGLESSNGYAAFDGQTMEDMDEEDRELLISSLENSLRLAKRLSKQKFTPKKYRN